MTEVGVAVRRRHWLRVGGLALVVAVTAAVAGCAGTESTAGPPELAPRGEAMTTAKPTRQDLSNKVSLSGKVTLNPVFGIVAPVAGQVRYFDLRPAQGTPTKPTRVASVWANGKPTNVDLPAGAVFSGRLADDRSTVAAGTPIVSAKRVGYGIVADIDGDQAYKITDALTSIQAQIKNGPGPFPCSVLGTIAALPAGTLPEPPPPAKAPAKGPAKNEPDPGATPGGGPGREGGEQPSEPTGMRLVCTAPGDVRLINGANATIEVVTQRASNVLVVPVEAVAGSQGKGKVDVIRPDKSRETRDVVLGLTDGKVIEIRSGLTGDETLGVPGPNLPAAPGGDPSGPGGGK